MHDIIFISYKEPNADENFELLKRKYPLAKRVNGVKGIHQAHVAAAKKCFTKMFWVVDGDAQVIDSFNFDYEVPDHQTDHVHVWKSINPVNGLIYGYGGVKLLPRRLTMNMDLSKTDMSTSISKNFKTVSEISNFTRFNTDPFNTWKSAFRECVKLSSKIIDRQKDEETNRRLRVWCTYLEGNPQFGEFALKGAKEGAAYGARHRNDKESLKMINDFNWLKDKFDGNI